MLNDRSSLVSFLKSRKSASAKAMGEPGPSANQLADILQMAVRVPDHGKLAPWRFIVFEGASRPAIGEVFAKRHAALHPTHSVETLAFQRDLFTRAPVVVTVVSSTQQHPKIPAWEQQLSAAAVCFNVVLAAQAHGFDAQWQTDWVAYDSATCEAMGVRTGERVAGLIYLGTSTVRLEDRPRPDARALTTFWSSP